MLLTHYHLVPDKEASKHKLVGCECDPHYVCERGASELIIHKYLEGNERGSKVQKDYKVWKFSKVK